jgi:hypothetical protein
MGTNNIQGDVCNITSSTFETENNIVLIKATGASPGTGTLDIDSDNYVTISATNYIFLTTNNIHMGYAVSTGDNLNVSFQYFGPNDTSNFATISVGSTSIELTNNGTIVVPPLTTPALIVSNPSTNPIVTTAEFLTPNFTGAQTQYVVIGQSSTTSNAGLIQYYHAGPANANNFIGIGMYNQPASFLYYETKSVAQQDMEVQQQLRSTSTAEPTDFTGATGAICTLGGISAAKSIWVGSLLYIVTSDTYITKNTTSLNFITGTDKQNFQTASGVLLVLGKDYQTYPQVSARCATDATDFSGQTGGLCTIGGVSIYQSCYVGEDIYTKGHVYYGASSADYTVYSSFWGGMFNYSTSTTAFANALGDIMAVGTKYQAYSQVYVIADQNSTDSSGTTGSLCTAGGLSVKKDAYFGGLVRANDTTDSTNLATGAVVVTGGAAIAKNLSIGQTTHLYGTADSTSTTSGILIVDGGVGIAKNLSVGQTTHLYGTADSTSTTSGILIIDGGMGIAKNLSIGATTHLYGTTDSTSTSTGTLIVDGGAAIAKNLYVGSVLTVTNSSAVSVTTANFLSPSLASSNFQEINFGVATTANNCGILIFNNAGGSGSSLNHMDFGMFSNPVCLSIYPTSVSIPISTASTSTTSGALQVTGGVGIQGKTFIGDELSLVLTSTTPFVITNSATTNTVFLTSYNSSLTTSNTIATVFGKSISNAAILAYAYTSATESNNYVYIGLNTGTGDLSIDYFGNIQSSSTTDATSASGTLGNGGIASTGGLSIAKKAFIGDEVALSAGIRIAGGIGFNSNFSNQIFYSGYWDGVYTYSQTSSTFSSPSGDILTIGKKLSSSYNQVAVLADQNSSGNDGTNGSLCTLGGASIKKDLYVLYIFVCSTNWYLCALRPYGDGIF